MEAKRSSYAQKREYLKMKIEVASGRKKAPKVFKDAKIINVYTQEILQGDIALVNGEIVGIGEYSGIEEINLGGRYAAPGFIDGHVHIESSMVGPREFAKVVMPKGTTTVIADPHEIANIRGIEGIRYMLESSRNLPLEIFYMLPSCVPSTEFENAGAKLLAEDLETLIHRKNILGLGELMDYPGVIGAREDILDKIVMVGDQIIDGHGPEIGSHELNAYRAAGVMTEHECSTLVEMQERLRLGMYILIRQGSAAQNLKTLIHGVNKENMRRCLFCTDDRHPEDLLQEGHIDHIIRQAVSHGMDPVTAITMATLNAAECYGLRKLGAIAPGKWADIVILDDLEDLSVHSVYKRGENVQELLENHREEIVDERWVKNTMNLHKVKLTDFELQLNRTPVRLIEVLPGSIITKKAKGIVTKREGKYFTDEGKPVLKMAVIERHHKSGNVGLGLVKNFGLNNGAIAMSIGHDSHNLIAIGDCDRDLLLAVRDVERMDGGISVVSDETILGRLPLSIAGIMSKESMEKVNSDFKEMQRIVRNELKVNAGIDPFMTLSFLALPVVPEIKLTDMGLFDVEEFQFVDLTVKDSEE